MESNQGTPGTQARHGLANSQETEAATILITETATQTAASGASQDSSTSTSDCVRRFGGSLGQIKPSRPSRDYALDLPSSSDDEEEQPRTPRPSKVPRLPNASYSSTSTLTSGSSNNKVVAPSTSTTAVISASEKYYIDNGNDKKILLSMLLGLKQDEPSFGDPDHSDSIYNTKGKSKWSPSGDQLVQEVIRRHKLLYPGQREKECKSWKKYKARQWLINNPIMEQADIRFLLEEEKKFRNVLLASEDEKNNQNPSLNQTAQPRTDWIGLMPWLRLGHVLVHDSVYELYQDKDRWEGRAGTDGRNSDQRPKQWFEKAAEVYNDETITFDSLLLPDLHSDFAQSYKLDKTNTPMTNAETIKKKAASARAEILCIIDKWERSGNGSGQRAEDDHEFGSIRRDGDQLWLVPGTTAEEPEFQDGDNRANFLGGKGSHVLYLWELLDQNQMLQTTITCLPIAIGADGANVPLARGRPKKPAELPARQLEEAFQKSSTEISASLRTIAEATKEHTLEQRIRRLNDSYMDIRREIRVLREDIRDCVEDDEKIDLKEELKRLVARREEVYEKLKLEESKQKE